MFFDFSPGSILHTKFILLAGAESGPSTVAMGSGLIGHGAWPGPAASARFKGRDWIMISESGLRLQIILPMNLN